MQTQANGDAVRDVVIDFGDGESRSLSVASTGGTTTVAHVYEDDGTFTVRVTATDASATRRLRISSWRSNRRRR